MVLNYFILFTTIMLFSFVLYLYGYIVFLHKFKRSATTMKLLYIIVIGCGITLFTCGIILQLRSLGLIQFNLTQHLIY